MSVNEIKIRSMWESFQDCSHAVSLLLLPQNQSNLSEVILSCSCRFSKSIGEDWEQQEGSWLEVNGNRHAAGTWTICMAGFWWGHTYGFLNPQAPAVCLSHTFSDGMPIRITQSCDSEHVKQNREMNRHIQDHKSSLCYLSSVSGSHTIF